jgi:hypothetical protein
MKTIEHSKTQKQTPVTISIQGLTSPDDIRSFIQTMIAPDFRDQVTDSIQTAAEGATTLSGYICCDFNDPENVQWYWCPGPGGVCSYGGRGCPS